ncbi:MAG TPA: putative DNA binding domain-containing protein [Anaerohalosphaeraceae bacterium]|nr:putative DNA binding domain-containing protein [Anaerohalosphaeraceae bacterium]
MQPEEIQQKIETLLRLPHETEWVEFKAAQTSFDFGRLGQYFSALSNEANLNQKPSGWLLFGIESKQHRIIGTSFRSAAGDLNKLKYEIACKTNNRITFSEIYEYQFPQGRVVLFEIPPAPQGIPTSWDGHFYGREGESLGPLNLHEIEQIRSQNTRQDWSADICVEASVNDLHPDAIRKARELYSQKNPEQQDEVDKWDDITFLNKIKLAVRGKLTRAAIVLLGRSEATSFLSPSQAQITWVVYNDKNTELDYKHYGPPFLLQADKVLANIRNLNYRYLPAGTLFPTEITMYDPYVIREALHNCIAHQDYTLQGRISIAEKPDELIFTNLGSFIPGSIEAVITENSPPAQYRNPLLAQAMVQLKMIDTIGSGIRKMFEKQRERFFPLPDYEFSQGQNTYGPSVTVRIQGKILDENYTRLLIRKPDLKLEDVMLLDKVQKHQNLIREQCNYLKKLRLVEGRYPNIYISSVVAEIFETKEDYIKNRAFDDSYYKQLIIDYLRKYGQAKRREIDRLLWDKLSDILTVSQKKHKIKNILSAMSKNDKTIDNHINRYTWTINIR